MIVTKDRERLVNEIAKTSVSIRKKYCALKSGRMHEDVALERHFRPVIEPLKQIAEGTTTVKSEMQSVAAKDESVADERAKTELALKRSSDLWLTPARKSKYSRLSDVLESADTTLDDRLFENPATNALPQEDVQKEMDKVQEQQPPHPLGQKYVEAVLRDDKTIDSKIIDDVYGVYLKDNITMLGNKRFDVDGNDDIIIDGTRYVGTPGIYELIFMKLPIPTLYTEDDIERYKNILLATNAYKRNYDPLSTVKSNKGYKYKHVIAPLITHTLKKAAAEGKGLSTMAVNDNAIDYIHWDDPNELVDRLRLLEASHQAGNNAHGNEITSIIEELREAGLIIN